MKRTAFCLCCLLLSGLFFQDSVAHALALELDRVFYSSNPSFKWVHGTAYANDGTLWVADHLNDGIYQYDPNQLDGAYATPLFSFSLATVSPFVRDMAWDHDTDTPWVAFNNGNIVNYDQSGGFISLFDIGPGP